MFAFDLADSSAEFLIVLDRMKFDELDDPVFVRQFLDAIEFLSLRRGCS